MIRRLLLTGGLAAAVILPGVAQSQTSSEGGPADGGAGVRSGHITSTGETVPNPGASQGAGTTSMDKGIQERDNKIDTSICKGC